MNLQVSKLLGLKISTTIDHPVQYYVADVLYDLEQNSVAGLVVHTSETIASKVIPFSSILSISENTVTIPDNNSLLDSELFGEKKLQAVENSQIMGMSIKTHEGKDLGRVDDVIVDTVLGSMMGYVSSAGVLDDMFHGKNYVPVTGNVTIIGDVICVPNLEEVVKKSIDGIQKQSTTTEIKTKSDDAWEELKESAQKRLYPLNNFSQNHHQRREGDDKVIEEYMKQATS
jgi:uncharacterized protein YrrD